MTVARLFSIFRRFPGVWHTHRGLNTFITPPDHSKIFSENAVLRLNCVPPLKLDKTQTEGLTTIRRLDKIADGWRLKNLISRLYFTDAEDLIGIEFAIEL